MFENLARDVRHAVRMLARNPGLTSVAMLSLAIGIGANTAIFSVVDALMLRRLPVRDPGGLVSVDNGPSGAFLQYRTFEQLRDAAADVADLAAIVRTDRYNVAIGGSAGGGSAVDGGPVRLSLVSGGYFPTIGVSAALGRALAPPDDRPGAPPVAVIGDDYWSRRFARAPDVLGRTLTFGDAPYEIVGVMPPAFRGEWIGRPADVWAPIVRQPEVMVELPVGGLRNAAVFVMGRLKAGATAERVSAALQIAYEQELRSDLGSNPTPDQLRRVSTDRIAVWPAPRGYSPQRRTFGRSLTILMGAVGVVLLVACANIANLLLARAEARRREMAVRLAIGAGRGRLVRQLLTESVVLAGVGGALGLIVAQWATAGLAAFLRGGPATTAGAALSVDLDVRPDARVVAFTAAVCVAAGVVFGLAPAFRGSRIALAPSLVGRGPSTNSGEVRAGGWGRLPLGKLLVVAQVALSLMLVVGAGLFVRTLRNLAAQPLGFDRDRVLLVWTLPGQAGVEIGGRGAGAADFWLTAQTRVAALPGVSAAGASNQGVLNGSDVGGLGSGPGLRIEGEPPAAHGIPGLRSFVTPGFFATMGIRLVEGRYFTEADTATAPRGVIVSQTFARHYFGDRSAVGHRVWFPEDTTAPTEIVGVVRDFLIGNPRETGHRPGATYFSYRDREASRRLRTMMMAVRTAGDPASVANGIRRVFQDPSLRLPLLKIDTVDEQVGDVLVQERMVTTLSAVFGVVSLVLACIGLYGVISYAVARRTNEIGIRMALGATRGAVLRAVLGESLALVAAGVAIGLAAAAMSARLVAARLFGVAATDPTTVAVATVLMVGVATIAALLPAGRAARVNPLEALRVE